jgi:hypothetical protein
VCPFRSEGGWLAKHPTRELSIEKANPQIRGMVLHKDRRGAAQSQTEELAVGGGGRVTVIWGSREQAGVWDGQVAGGS